MLGREKIIQFFLWLCSFITILTSISIVVVLVFETISFFQEVSIVDFFTDEQWTPFYNDKHFGILPLLTGTLLVALIASLVAIPTGLTIAIYLSEYANATTKSYLKPLLEFLAAIPTVVYGYFALTIVTPFLQSAFQSDIFQFLFPGASIAGFNALSAGVVIGLMITPIVSSLSEDALQSVPKSLKESSYALGATKFQTAVKVLLPAASSGIIVSFILAISRAVGETMIVSIAAGQQPRLTLDPTVPIETISSFIVQVSLGDVPHGSLEYKTIYATGLCLFLFSFLLNNLSYAVRNRFKLRYE